MRVLKKGSRKQLTTYEKLKLAYGTKYIDALLYKIQLCGNVQNANQSKLKNSAG